MEWVFLVLLAVFSTGDVHRLPVPSHQGAMQGPVMAAKPKVGSTIDPWSVAPPPKPPIISHPN